MPGTRAAADFFFSTSSRSRAEPHTPRHTHNNALQPRAHAVLARHGGVPAQLWQPHVLRAVRCADGARGAGRGGGEGRRGCSAGREGGRGVARGNMHTLERGAPAVCLVCALCAVLHARSLGQQHRPCPVGALAPPLLACQKRVVRKRQNGCVQQRIARSHRGRQVGRRADVHAVRTAHNERSSRVVSGGALLQCKGRGACARRATLSEEKHMIQLSFGLSLIAAGTH